MLVVPYFRLQVGQGIMFLVHLVKEGRDVFAKLPILLVQAPQLTLVQRVGRLLGDPFERICKLL